MARFDTVFFDSGGTLFESDGSDDPRGWPDRGRRLQAALRAWGCDIDPDAIERVRLELERDLPVQHGAGYTHYKLIKSLARRFELRLADEELACVTDTYSGPRFESWLFPGTGSMLQRLEDAGTYVGLMVNTFWPGWTMERSFTGVGLLRHFRVRVYSGDLGIVKPDVGIFREAERCANLSPGKHLLYVGNTIDEDIAGAEAAGWSTAFRKSPETPDSQGRADFDFSQWSELIDFILE